MTPSLCDIAAQAKRAISTAAVRLREPNRRQVELRAQDLDSLIAEGHQSKGADSCERGDGPVRRTRRAQGQRDWQARPLHGQPVRTQVHGR